MRLKRRQFVRSTLISGLTLGLAPRAFAMDEPGGNAPEETLYKIIPSSGERLAVVGMGTSRTFSDAVDPARLREVLRIFFDLGGQLIDSSPMYGPAERLLGELLPAARDASGLFAATKVWTDGRKQGLRQMQNSLRLMGVDTMDLMQIHNLRDWKTHLATLRDWKAAGRIRYLGITTSHGRFHAELEEIMRREKLDFIQLSYNIEDRETEKRLLPLAADQGIATLINRPYQRGALFRRVKGKMLPEWAAEIDCRSWGQFFLKFAAGHPAATCVIPATSQPRHMRDNMGANRGRLPDQAMRKAMLDYYKRL